jgi:D-glycerate 3-kinase
MIERYYREVFDWCQGYRTIGLSGPQGAGKSTLVRQLVARYAERGMRAVAVSIDDFYLTHAEQRRLARQHPTNRYLQKRGYPGTHDVALGDSVLTALLSLQDGQRLALPVYDKSAHGGEGDRAPASAWPVVEGRVDVVLLEGWMLGFRPVPDERLAHDPELAAVNRLLPPYERWYRHLDALLQLRVAEAAQIVRWRVEAEENMKRSGKSGMSTATVRAYIETFLPAYAAYTETVKTSALPYRALELGADRLPLRD